MRKGKTESELDKGSKAEEMEREPGPSVHNTCNRRSGDDGITYAAKDATRNSKEKKEDRSGSEGNKGNTRAKKEQKRKGDDKRKESEIVDRMTGKCIREAEERGKDDERERKAIVQELKQACVTMWTSHLRYHCVADTPANERMDAIEISRGKCKPASRTPRPTDAANAQKRWQPQEE